MKNVFNTKIFCLITLMISILSLLSAIYIEHIIEIKPCKLCIYQRFPYLLAIFISFLGYHFSNNRLWIKLLALIFLISFVLSGYHVGIENEFFNEFSGCTNENINLMDKSKILNSLQNEANNCKNVNFKILGMSLATINMIISSLFLIIYLNIIRNEKNK